MSTYGTSKAIPKIIARLCSGDPAIKSKIEALREANGGTKKISLQKNT